MARWVTPEEFADWKRIGEQEYGFRHVESGPLVRSSYHAKEQAREVEAGGPGNIREVMEADIPAPAERPGLAGNGTGGTAGVDQPARRPELVQLRTAARSTTRTAATGS